MNLELLDAYTIRVRLSTSIILLSPIALTAFLCFKEITAFASSAVFVSLLLAFTNYIPILQRRIYQKRQFENYAAEFLYLNDEAIDSVTKQRYYNTLAKINEVFSPFSHPDDSNNFRVCCNSAVVYLKTHTRDNHLVQEELINYGFCKNLVSSKAIGIILCLFLDLIIIAYSYFAYKDFANVPAENQLAFIVNIIMLLFWIFGVTKPMLANAAEKYAKTLLEAIDTLE